MSADQGTGTTMAFTSAGAIAFESGVTFIDVGGSVTRGAVDTTHLGTTVAMTYEPADLYDSGEVTMTIDWDPEEMLISANFIMTLAAGTVTITFPNADTYAFSGFFTSLNWGPVAVNTRMQANLTLKATGAITIT
jgi:hypothetical protein